jgi:hypothetical protein
MSLPAIKAFSWWRNGPSFPTLLKIYMKYSAVLSILMLFACGYNRNVVRTKLLTEQEILKDSANNIRERIGRYTEKGVYDSAMAKRKLLGTVHARLIDIQSSIDSLVKMK